MHAETLHLTAELHGAGLSSCTSGLSWGPFSHSSCGGLLPPFARPPGQRTVQREERHMVSGDATLLTHEPVLEAKAAKARKDERAVQRHGRCHHAVHLRREDGSAGCQKASMRLPVCGWKGLHALLGKHRRLHGSSSARPPCPRLLELRRHVLEVDLLISTRAAEARARTRTATAVTRGTGWCASCRRHSCCVQLHCHGRRSSRIPTAPGSCPPSPARS